jgi:ubiquinone/menaquinone biosynthesis C-methylase UbiE
VQREDRRDTRAYRGTKEQSSLTTFTKSPRTPDRPTGRSTSQNKKATDLTPDTYHLKATPDTSWGGVADWYNKHLEKTDDSYHVKVVFPNVLRMLGDVTGKKILDMACGQGIFADKLRDAGASVTGVDIGKELITLAETRNESVKVKGTHKITYHVTSADDLYMLKDKSFDTVVCILAIQNIENLDKTISEASRVLIDGGTMFLILNHPSFRNPKQTYWGYNEADDAQYRRVDEYMSESRVKIDMTPGSVKDKKFTVSFHRPLQVYVKALAKSGFAIIRLEEWTSHKESEKGPKQRAENKARKEIPMFMCMEAKIGVRG